MMRVFLKNICIIIGISLFAIICFGATNKSNAVDNQNDDLPEFYGTTSITIRVGDTFDLKKSYYRIYAKDRLDGNITKNIQIVRNNVSRNTVGNYQVEYKVTNSRGKTKNIIVPVQVVENGERKIQRTLYVLPNVNYLNNSGFRRGNMQDNQNLGFYLPAGVSVKARQINKQCQSDVYVSFYNNDNLTENATGSKILGLTDDYDVFTYDMRKKINHNNDSYIDLQNVTKIKRKPIYAEDKEENYTIWQEYSGKTYDSIPMVKTIYGINECPVIEIILNDSVKELDYFTYGDNELNFRNKWRNDKNECAILDGDRIQFIVPYKDLEQLGISKKEQNNNYRHDNFNTIESILKYYDNVIETYDECIGLSYDANEYYDKNVKTKFLVKCIKHGGNILAAYSPSDYIYSVSDSLDIFLHNEGSGWGPLHEIGHGYQGNLKYLSDLYLVEISNNFLAYYYQKSNLSGEDWLAEYNGNEIMRLVRSTSQSYLTEYNNPHIDENATGINDYKMKLFAYINLLNKIDYKKALAYTYSYYRYLQSTNQINGKSAIDIIVKGFSDGTGYNVIPYFEDWRLKISDSIKNEIYKKDYPILYYIRDLVAYDSEAVNVKNYLHLPWNFSVIENKDIAIYKYTGNLNINLDDTQFNALNGNKLLLKSGNNIIKKTDITSKIINFTNIPVGIYEIEIEDNSICHVNNCYTVISKNYTSEESIDIIKKELVDINIKEPPKKTQYIEGEDFDPTGMVIEAIYNNDTTEEIENYTLIKSKDLKLNRGSISITYTFNGITKRKTQPITVIAKQLSNIIVTHAPKTINYIEGQNFDRTGMIVTAKYNDGSTKDIEDYIIIGENNLQAGKANVTISYTENDITKTTTQDIIVAAKKLSSIAVTHAPKTTNYIEGQEFDRTEMKVTATYDNGSSKEITDYIIPNEKNLQLGQTNVTISYTENGITKTTIQNINVTKKEEKEELYVDIKTFDVKEETEGKYVEKIMPETSIETIKQNIETNGEIGIYNKKGEKITNEKELISTGMEIVIKFDNEEKRYTAVVKGDITGDGKMDISDLTKLSRHIAEIDKMTNRAYLKASDVYEKDGKYGVLTDLVKMSRVLAEIDNL